MIESKYDLFLSIGSLLCEKCEITIITTNIVTIQSFISMLKKFVISTIHSHRSHTHTHIHTVLPPSFNNCLFFSLFHLFFYFLAAMLKLRKWKTTTRQNNYKQMLTFDCESVKTNATRTHTHSNGGSTMWMTKVAWCDSKFDILVRFYIAVIKYV